MAGRKATLKATIFLARKSIRQAKRLFTRKTMPSSIGKSISDEPSKSSETAESPKDEVNQGILLSVEIIEHVREMILEGRRLEAEERDYQALIDALDHKMNCHYGDINALEIKLGRADVLGKESEAQIAEWNAALARMNKRFDDMEADNEMLHDKLRDVRDRQRDEFLGLYAAFDPFLVEHGLIEEFDGFHYPPVKGFTKQLSKWTGADLPDNPLCQPPDTTPQCDSQDITEESSKQPSDGETLRVDPDVVLKGDYGAAKAELRAREEAFEMRHERFDNERAQLQQELQDDERDDSSTAFLKFDQYELQETRKLGQALSEAEHSLAKAKAACRAAPLDIASSDTESGFPDDTNDGYRESEEKEAMAAVNPGGILWWLEQIPDCPDGDSDALSQVSDADDWDARSVEMSDSASMVAEGSARRRIDKWWSACQRANFDEWFSAGWDGNVF